MFQTFALLSFGPARPFVLLSIPAITVTSCNLLACAVCLHKIRLLNCQRQNWPAKRNQQYMITVKSHHRGPTVSNMWLQVTLPSKPNFNFGLQMLKSFCQVGLRRHSFSKWIWTLSSEPEPDEAVSWEFQSMPCASNVLQHWKRGIKGSKGLQCPWATDSPSHPISPRESNPIAGGPYGIIAHTDVTLVNYHSRSITDQTLISKSKDYDSEL